MKFRKLLRTQKRTNFQTANCIGIVVKRHKETSASPQHVRKNSSVAADERWIRPDSHIFPIIFTKAYDFHMPSIIIIIESLCAIRWEGAKTSNSPAVARQYFPQHSTATAIAVPHLLPFVYISPGE